MIAAVPQASLATWGIIAAGMLGVLVRPFRLPEAVWAVAGAVALVVLGLLSPVDALHGVAKGADVYFFLIGMMLLAELAQREGLFDWVAAITVSQAKGSGRRLFVLVYLVGTVVTIFLSNDATAVVLTPAVYAATRAARTEPLPYLFICAFIANAASFVLPISNPANLVLFGVDLPALLPWLARFGLASVVSIAVTFALLYWSQRNALAGEIAAPAKAPALSRGGVVVALALIVAAIVLMIVSALGLDLGLPTFLVGVATLLVVTAFRGLETFGVVRHISWSVLPLVAGLFVFVEALDRTGVIALLGEALKESARDSPVWAAWAGALVAGFGSNLVNNLPVGLLAGASVGIAGPPTVVTDAILIGVDLGPNLSITGSLATILWLAALRRNDETVTVWQFLKLGALLMPITLVLTIFVRLATDWLLA